MVIYRLRKVWGCGCLCLLGWFDRYSKVVFRGVCLVRWSWLVFCLVTCVMVVCWVVYRLWDGCLGVRLWVLVGLEG